MLDLKNMDYEKIFDLNNKVLTLDQLEELEENEWVESVECLGYSGQHPECEWYDIKVFGKHIDVYLYLNN